MLDPLGGFARIREQYITYLETAFRIANPEISRARRELLEDPGQLCSHPLIEPIPNYETVDWTIADVPAGGSPIGDWVPPEALATFGQLIAAGLFDRSDISLYEHQATMLLKGLQQGQPGIVTSGTGSGKTEAFLLPVIAQICKEGAGSNGWTEPAASFLRKRWWHKEPGKSYSSFTKIEKSRRPLQRTPNATPFEAHRAGETRVAAMRCLILYPMNALVEDQLARIRRALDSPEAREIISTGLNGNRIFFGRYTGQTPVTGFHEHPRIDPSEYASVKHKRLASLFDQVTQMERTQEWIAKEQKPGGRFADTEEDVRYLFPAVDGAELTNRWDMQLTPPDILISNISMLGAMLNREVDAPIFEETRRWIEQNDDAYFYLVLDELHLHRGSSGTEVAYLVRLLLHRLGLTKPEHRHKLRILASSASLPVDGEAGEKSERYLEDMFGSFGLDSLEGYEPSTWRHSIVPGNAMYVADVSSVTLDPAPFAGLATALGGSTHEPVKSADLPIGRGFDACIGPVANALGVDASANAEDRLRQTIELAARRITNACRSTDGGQYRAMPLPDIAERVFGDGSELEAVRGLLAIRGLGDVFLDLYPGSASPDANRFRIHTFFRAIEGLYAPLDSSLSDIFGQLSVERAYKDGQARPLDLLYCECCGALMVGGRRSAHSSKKIELVPVSNRLEDMPERVSSDRFEDQTHEGYAIFYPSPEPQQPGVAHKSERWNRALLDPVTGEVHLKRTPSMDSALIEGWSYHRTGRDEHKRAVGTGGTHVPYQCPSCDEEYSKRRLGSGRLSPVRHFRPGFAKTTQLLSSELFDLLRIETPRAKLVSFSDSRQEAARAALDVEGRHHEDLRRQVLFAELKRIRENAPSAAEAEQRSADLTAKALKLGAADPEQALALFQEITALKKAATSHDPNLVGPISDLLQDYEGTKYIGKRDDRTASLGGLLQAFARLGVHPVDPAGVSSIKSTVDNHDRSYSWPELFEHVGASVDWRDGATDQAFRNNARQSLLKQSHRNLTETLFSRTYFAMEETGLGYPCLSRQPGESAEEHERHAAFLRVFANAYRLLDSPFDNTPKPLHAAAEFGVTNRARLFSEIVAGTAWESELNRFIARLSADGHHQSLIRTPALFVKLVEPTDPAWRCAKCARVHLHKGYGTCTRCRSQLSADTQLTAADVAAGSYLGRKVARASSPFRLHCEELTGQTDDGADRQRAFKEVLVDDLVPLRSPNDGEIVRDEDGTTRFEEASAVWPEKEKIDLLSVTTTMEVGIDIGSLQGVLQANMPPQRFNYQQRVGRAGRRGQAFSMALTVCRTKSHDLYYFRDTKKITGDTPPPPFLARSRPEIALRFHWKNWLTLAFNHLRANASVWPADGMRPPDIHGEFTTTDLFANDPNWATSLLAALSETHEAAAGFALVLNDIGGFDGASLEQSPVELLQRIKREVGRPEVQREGLAHTMAEAGLLPMYGMPTRVRNLYTGTRWSPEGMQWRTIDRDIDIAIHEFAPRATIIKDKRTHLAVGFTGPLAPPLPGGGPVQPFSEAAFGPGFKMAECEVCRSWHRSDQSDAPTTCSYCGTRLTEWRECYEPLGFRTDFRPNVGQLDVQTAGRTRSVQAESFTVLPQRVPDTNAVTQLKIGGRTYRINRGDPEANDEWSGFNVERFTHSSGPPRNKRPHLHQWFDVDLLADDDSQLYSADLTPEGERIQRAWLVAPKTTDVLIVAPAKPCRGLGLHLLERVGSISTPNADKLLGMQATAIRAAALSATFILIYRAALELDVDPEEFDVIEPRLSNVDGEKVPILQIADFLVNGAGLCAAIGSDDGNTPPLISQLIQSIATDSDSYPSATFGQAAHTSACGSACYVCLMRHSNQPFHGLLDWRLGMAIISCMADDSFDAGLSGDFSSLSMHDWHSQVEKSLVGLGRRRAGKIEQRMFGQLQAFRDTGQSSNRWTLVTHPLWDPVESAGCLAEAQALAGGDAAFVDSFSLARRPWMCLETLTTLPQGPLLLSSGATDGARPDLVQMLNAHNLPMPVEGYRPPGLSITPLDYAWPHKQRPACLLDSLDDVRDGALVGEGWRIFGPPSYDELQKLIRYLRDTN